MIGFASAVSDTSALVCSPACYSWASGDIVPGASARLAIAACVCSKAFRAFTQDTAISWDVEELYFMILFKINGGTGA